MGGSVGVCTLIEGRERKNLEGGRKRERKKRCGLRRRWDYGKNTEGRPKARNYLPQVVVTLVGMVGQEGTRTGQETMCCCGETGRKREGKSSCHVCVVCVACGRRQAGRRAVGQTDSQVNSGLTDQRRHGTNTEHGEVAHGRRPLHRGGGSSPSFAFCLPFSSRACCRFIHSFNLFPKKKSDIV
ncbi:hypothetical protein LY78DRAFT_423152 [Colletotrichum sublineola]|nr:hypothetical protein LY78DRAFT_423152 [Colletotrichum sublineola]